MFRVLHVELHVLLFTALLLLCAANLRLNEGEICNIQHDAEWTCTPLENCNHVDLKVFRPVTCSVKGNTNIVCCPPKKNERLRLSKVQSACARYQGTRRCIPRPPENPTTTQRRTNADGVPYFPLVVGGVESKPKAHPETALLGTGPENDINWVCGGSLISEKWILSAAHCEYAGIDQTPLGWVKLGELDQSSEDEDARPILRKIVRRIHHPRFRTPPIYNDVALFEMEKPVEFNDYVSPVCLYSFFDVRAAKATVVGWGRTGFVDDLSSKLLETEISLINHTDCAKLYGTDETVPRGVDRLAMICAGEKEGGKDACKGDSGGPLFIFESGGCLKSQVGIVSTGRGCGEENMPGIYTRVSTYVPWIESIVWP